MELDYNKLLDDWADELFAKADEYAEKRDKQEIGSYNYGYYNGISEALYLAITKLTIRERRYKKKFMKE